MSKFFTTCNPDLEASFEASIKRLNELYKEQFITDELNLDILKLNKFYTEQFYTSELEEDKKLLVDQHRLIVLTIEGLKEGLCTSDMALKEIEKIATARSTKLLLSTIFKACELVFWITAAFTSYAFCIGFGIPIMFFNPVAGLLITLGTSILLLEAISSALDCINQFQSPAPLEEEKTVERHVISLFAQAQGLAHPADDRDAQKYDEEECAAPCYP